MARIVAGCVQCRENASQWLKRHGSEAAPVKQRQSERGKRDWSG